MKHPVELSRLAPFSLAASKRSTAFALAGGGAVFALGCLEPPPQNCSNSPTVAGSSVLHCSDSTWPPSAGDAKGAGASSPTPDGEAGALPADTGTRFAVSSPSGRRHVILVIGDGMGYAHQVAGSRYRCGTDRCLSFHDFPVQALVTTWSATAYDAHAAAVKADPYSQLTYDPVLGYDPARGGYAPYPMLADSRGAQDYFVNGPYTDSAAAATAMATGFKTSNGALAQDPKGAPWETSAERLRRTYGMAIGLVTTVPFSDATPAGFVAHAQDRGLHHEIAHQMLNACPEVVIGAGMGTGGDWIADEDVSTLKSSADYVYVERGDQNGGAALLNASASAVLQKKKLWGLFGVDNFGFEGPVAVHSPGRPRVQRASDRDPSLPQATIAAIDVLAQNPAGFFLMVEQGAIDKRSHNNDYDAMVGCVWELDDTIKAIVHYVDRPGDAIDWTNTTVFVLADHETGFLRFTGAPLGAGELGSESGGYSWGATSHTNQLIALSATGAYAHRVTAYAQGYGGRPILDNTAIFALTLDASER